MEARSLYFFFPLSGCVKRTISSRQSFDAYQNIFFCFSFSFVAFSTSYGKGKCGKLKIKKKINIETDSP